MRGNCKIWCYKWCSLKTRSCEPNTLSESLFVKRTATISNCHFSPECRKCIALPAVHKLQLHHAIRLATVELIDRGITKNVRAQTLGLTPGEKQQCVWSRQLWAWLKAEPYKLMAPQLAINFIVTRNRDWKNSTQGSVKRGRA